LARVFRAGISATGYNPALDGELGVAAQTSKADIDGIDLVQVVLAEPFPGTVAQGVVLVTAMEFSGLCGSGLRMPTGIDEPDRTRRPDTSQPAHDSVPRQHSGSRAVRHENNK